VDAFGRLDVLVNNAGFGFIGAIEERRPLTNTGPMFETNIIGLLETTRAALPALRKTGAGGRIVNMSFRRGHQGPAKARDITTRRNSRSKAFPRPWLRKSPPFWHRGHHCGAGSVPTDFLGRSISLAKKEMPEYAGTSGVFRTFRANNDRKQVGDPDKAVQVIPESRGFRKAALAHAARKRAPLRWRARRSPSSRRTSTPGKRVAKATDYA